MNFSNVYPLKGAVQHYAWGGSEFIPNLLDISNSDTQPFAELWMGTHNRGPAIIKNGNGNLPLNELIQQSPESILGEKVINTFGVQLPFLFKVLDVKKMLSIQAHPNKQQAEEGFKLENEAGVPLTAFHRNYKDNNHKPEIMVSLTDFWLLHGFKDLEQIEIILKIIPEFVPLQKFFKDQSLFELYKGIMEMDQPMVDEILTPLANRLAQQQPPKENPDYWAKQAFIEYQNPEGHCDRGIFSIYLFNLVHLKPGEGIFQGAGVPHAYLEGVNMELMANSDNVFRGGLTQKHIDVPELLRHLIIEPVVPKVLKGIKRGEFEQVYTTPAPDFELSRITLSKDQEYDSLQKKGPEILILINGQILVNQEFTFKKGEIFFVPASKPYVIKCQEEAVLFKATVP